MILQAVVVLRVDTWLTRSNVDAKLRASVWNGCLIPLSAQPFTVLQLREIIELPAQ